MVGEERTGSEGRTGVEILNAKIALLHNSPAGLGTHDYSWTLSASLQLQSELSATRVFVSPSP